MSDINSFEVIKRASYLVNPNIGRPIILNIDPKLKAKSLQTHLLFISNINDQVRFERSIKNKLQLVPILEYKWKLKLVFEKMKKEIELSKEKKGFLSKWKTKKAIKKEAKKNFDQLKSGNEKQLDKLKIRAYRGDPTSPTILNVENVSIKGIDDLKYDEYYSPQKYLIKHKVFRNYDIFYKVLIEFDLTKEVKDFLKGRNFIMFDIVHTKNDVQVLSNNSSDRINYHSIVVSKQKWKDFTYIHATDLHLAERNDRIFEIIKKWTQMFSGDYKEEILKEQKKKSKSDDERDKALLHIPLKKRFTNPNNQFRRFIKNINQKIIDNKVDFVALTGDIVDFSLMSKFPKDLKLYYNFEHSNWRIFKEIILNLPQKRRKGVIKGEELLCPIFTIPGNHDYRPFHYDMRWAGLYRKMGLKASEAIALNDKLLALPVSAIVKSMKSLIPYWLEINSSLDYYFKLGNSNFIFLNTGSDSYSVLGDFITGHPALTGLKKKQIIYLENLLNNKINPNDNTFLFLHGPVINTRKQVGLIKRIQKSFGKNILTKIDDFKESLLQKSHLKTLKTRIDGKFSLKYGTISSNWEKFIKFCKDHSTITFTGHTHKLKEFRLGEPEEKKTHISVTPPFILKKVENPAAVFYDTYSEIFTNAKEIAKFGPFVVQTPALGLGGYKGPSLAGSYRTVKIRDGKLSSFKVKSLRK